MLFTYTLPIPEEYVFRTDFVYQQLIGTPGFDCVLLVLTVVSFWQIRDIRAQLAECHEGVHEVVREMVWVLGVGLCGNARFLRIS
eukprot:s1889_g2.t1